MRRSQVVRHRVLVSAFPGSNPGASDKQISRRSSRITNIKAVILAAGKGVRMESDLPKVLHPLQGRPLIQHVIDNIKKSGICDIFLVVGYKGNEVISAIGDSAKFVWQHEQLGTGHAALQAEKALQGFSGSVLLACGDVPLIQPDVFKKMIDGCCGETKAVVLTMLLQNPSGYGRIIKDENENFIRIVEEKDADAEEKKVREVNTGTYLFDSRSLFSCLNTIGTDNAQGEYYLTDVLRLIKETGSNVNTVLLENSIHGSGINSKEDLARLEKFLEKNQVPNCPAQRPPKVKRLSLLLSKSIVFVLRS